MNKMRARLHALVFRYFTHSVCRRNFVPESPKLNFRHIPRNNTYSDDSINPATLVPRLLRGETVQGFLTGVYIPQHVHTDMFNGQPFTRVFLQQLLYVD